MGVRALGWVLAMLVWMTSLGVAQAQVPAGTSPVDSLPLRYKKRTEPSDTSKAKQAFKKDEKPASHLGRHRIGHFVHAEIGAGTPGGELANRFGSHIYASVGYTMALPSKWTIGVEAGYGFSRGLKQDPISTLRDQNGDVIAKDGSLAIIDMSERLWVLPAIKFGRMIVLRERDKKHHWEHALLPQIGFSWLEYKYNINVVSNDVAQLDGTNKKAYDRLTAGPGALGELTYLLEAPHGNYGVFVKAQYLYAWSQSKRNNDFNLGHPTTGVMGASMANIQIGLVLSFFALDEGDYFYY